MEADAFGEHKAEDLINEALFYICEKILVYYFHAVRKRFLNNALYAFFFQIPDMFQQQELLERRELFSRLNYLVYVST